MAQDKKGDKGDMSVSEAGHKGGQRVRELIEEGKEAEGSNATDRDTERGKTTDRQKQER